MHFNCFFYGGGGGAEVSKSDYFKVRFKTNNTSRSSFYRVGFSLNYLFNLGISNDLHTLLKIFKIKGRLRKNKPTLNKE